MLDPKVAKVQEGLYDLETKNDLDTAKALIRSIVQLIVPDPLGNTNELFRIYNDKDGKLKANSGWFQSDDVIADRLAVYSIDLPPESNLDVKVFAVNKAKKGTISWAVGLTPNYEDEPFNGRYNVGIDFVIPTSKDRVIIALSKNYVIRTLELKGKLTATFLEILSSWTSISDTSRKAEFHSLLWSSLDLAPINKRFYEGISQRFIYLRQHLETFGVFDRHHSAQFANRLIGRIIFTWFLDKKGLLHKESEYFSSELFEDDTQYYREKLESLFFEVLNKPVAERTVLDVLTPYLNGGLFEPKKEDYYKTGNLTFPRNYFDDLYQFLKGYNFTTDESTSDFQQVAIDPEMLGRIFENLLAEVSEETGDQARKAKGAFYTPREIVDFMCKESLKGYLRSKIPNDPNLDSRIYQLIDATERQFQDQDHNWRRDLKPYKDQIIEALDNLKVFDPACGSGAFPIGMMQLLVRVYARLEPRFDNHKAKLAIIEKNIYGADIEPMAVEISRLRAWLALVVDEDITTGTIRPLPNLDFKFVSANSLVKLAPQGQLAFFEDASLDLKLQEIREKYFNTESLKQKLKLKERYNEIVQEEMSIFGESPRTTQLKTFRPFEADSVADFFDVNQMFGFDSFDVVIGNPPYVRQEKIRYKSKLQDYSVYQSTSDLYTYFYELALENLVDGGVVSFITSSKFGRALYGEKLRGLLSTKTSIDLIVDYGTSHVFAAITNTWVLQARKGLPRFSNEIEIKPSIAEQGMTITQEKLSSTSWAFLDSETEVVIEQIRSTGQTIQSQGYSIYRGLLTGCNEAFVIDDATRELLNQQDLRSSEIIKPLLRGRDIAHYEVKPVVTWILATRNGLDISSDYPAVAQYLEEMNAALDQRPKLRGDRGSHWMNLRDCSYYQAMESPKIVWIELSDKNKFAFSTGSEYLLAGAFMLVGPYMKPLLAVLNSKLIYFYFKFISNSSGMGTTQWKKFAVEKLPIPDFSLVDTSVLSRIEELVDSRGGLSHIESPVEVITIEAELDRIVFELYGLNEKHVELIEASLKSKLSSND